MRVHRAPRLSCEIGDATITIAIGGASPPFSGRAATHGDRGSSSGSRAAPMARARSGASEADDRRSPGRRRAISLSTRSGWGSGAPDCGCAVRATFGDEQSQDAAHGGLRLGGRKCGWCPFTSVDPEDRV